MASRFFWILGSLFALFLCLDAAFPCNQTDSENKLSIKTLKKMESEVRTHHNIPADRQFAVLHLPGRDPSGKDCHRINFNVAGEVNAYCNFAPVFDKTDDTQGRYETRRHSEWQLIHTALKTMLEKWKKEHVEEKCPEALYLYTFNAPDYIGNRIAYNLTCTQAIVYKIPEILKEDDCGRTSIVVGFSQVGNDFKNSTLKSCELMKKNNIIVHNLNNGRSNKEDHCRLVAEIGVQNTG